MAEEPAVRVETKPAEPADLRFAIRTATGQLLNYCRQQLRTGNRLVVVGSEIGSDDDRRRALGNGFGLAWQTDEDGLKIIWPPQA